MSQTGQTHFKNLANVARFLKCVWPFWDIMHWSGKSDEIFGVYERYTN